MNVLSRNLSVSSQADTVEHALDIFTRLAANKRQSIDWKKTDHFRFPVDIPAANPEIWRNQHWRWFMLAYGRQKLSRNFDLQLPTTESGKFRMDYSCNSDEAFLFDNRLNKTRGLALWKRLQENGFTLQSGAAEWEDCFGFSWYSSEKHKLLRRTNDMRVYLSYGPVEKNGSC